ncbi:MAG: hypothetical protein DWC06_07695 [Candidatus Poseidoniales archaeon]|nr:hypothetical protein [Candidatus Poseidoniales archaeon]RJV00075.1 MAG: hypothetical protein DWC06_07695 [Candidatus Poseidoniales archaeon]|tara:strand:- start:237 stop:419 length:183 start_codon:yes stop_codon:yes gene_type:complete
MPGTPYLEQPPKGLMTWPKLLKISVPILAAFTTVAWWNDLLIEWAILLTIGLIASFFIRR